ncbi:MAG: hypothetical protein KAX23_02970 [Dehalococcoidia bacterium]|nr:hypothetical protein [Dehalococcoidia bacterium]
MPQCGCFHNYDLIRIGSKDYKLTVHMEGQANLKDLLEKADLAQIVSVDRALFGNAFTLTAVREETALRDFLDLLSSRIIIDLAPLVEECYALAPWTVYEKWEQRARTRVGDLIYRAKYAKDEEAWLNLCAELEAFIARHPRLRSARAIVAAPKADASTPDLAGRWAEDIAVNRGWRLVRADKVRPTGPQKEMDEEETEEDVAARVANSVEVENLRRGADVLIVDDTVRSGGTMKEIARALRVAGAAKVFGISVAKDAKFTLGGIDLSREQWQ